MIKKILVPLDGSRLAEKALPYAIWLAKRLDASLIVTVASTLTGEEMGKDKNKNKENGKAKFETPEAYREVIRQTITDPASALSLVPHKLEIQVAYGEPVSEISEITFYEEVDLIVMANPRRKDFGYLFLGNLAAEVVRQAEVPVLLLNSNLAGEANQSLQKALSNHTDNFTFEKGGNKILLTLDGGVVAESAIKVAVELARQLRATLHLLRVVPEPDPGAAALIASSSVALCEREKWFNRAVKYLERLQAELLEKDLKCEQEVRSGQTSRKILEYAQELQPTLVVMATHARSRIGQIFLGSVAHEVTRQYPGPLILVHPSHFSKLDQCPGTVEQSTQPS
ncbi:MAG TPA: universal stress protein [Chloroflexia bacterium]|nr:universal stress protein [Chloroflexia bacterium]